MSESRSGRQYLATFPKGKKYDIIYADPAWRYRNKRTGGSLKSGATQKYPTMELDEIKRLPVKRIAAKDALLFLWITWPFMNKIDEVMNAWGFEYYGLAFDWFKINSKSPGFSFGMGFLTRGNSEVCLTGMRGTYRTDWLESRGVSSVIVWPRMAHSQKPPIVMTKIDELVGPKPKKIELFCRGPSAMGWDAWGYDAINCKMADLITKPKAQPVSIEPIPAQAPDNLQ